MGGEGRFMGGIPLVSAFWVDLARGWIGDVICYCAGTKSKSRISGSRSVVAGRFVLVGGLASLRH